MPSRTKTEVRSIPFKKDGASLYAWLEKHLKRRAEYERLVLFFRPQDGNLPLVEILDAAITFTQSYSKRHRQCLRLIFVFDPVVTWKWINYPPR